MRTSSCRQGRSTMCCPPIGFGLGCARDARVLRVLKNGNVPGEALGALTVVCGRELEPRRLRLNGCNDLCVEEHARTGRSHGRARL